MLSVSANPFRLPARPIGTPLPEHDIRTALDESVRRGWTEVSRRAARVGVLLAADTTAGLAGVCTALLTWGAVSNDGLRPLPSAIPLVAMVFCIQPLALAATRAYSSRGWRSLERIAAGVAISALVGWVQARLFGEMTPDLPNKTAYVYSGALIVAAIWLLRQSVQMMIQAGLRAGLLQRRALVVGERHEVRELRERTTSGGICDVAIVGSLSPDAALDRPTAIRDAVRDAGAQMVLIAPSIPFEAFRTMIFDCFTCGVGVSMLPRLVGSLGACHVEVRSSGIGVLLDICPLRLGVPQLALKRTMDVVLTTAGLLVAWPLFLVIAIGIKLDSPGPVLFRQTRAGVGGKPFQILKFRTMRVGADAEKAQLRHLNEYPDGRLFKIKEDPRITKLGRILRRCSLDELPQLWNVMRGEMSLVGPRPCLPEELSQYSDHHMQRLFVVPGITGPWQVSGRNEILDFEDVVRLESEYIQWWSLVDDVIILLCTIPTLFRRGAY
ncbi:MAG TPA: sugar transferase [Vicinamibacterales bacterium]|nr:sugar transferase [Vicinamibacterales bacterium]